MHAKVEVADRCYELRCGASLSLLTHSDADRVRTASLNISPLSASAGAFSSCQTAARCSKHEPSLARVWGWSVASPQAWAPFESRDICALLAYLTCKARK
jgi:hypothetical protein